MANARTHTALLAAQFPTTFSCLLDSHKNLRVLVNTEWMKFKAAATGATLVLLSALEQSADCSKVFPSAKTN